MMRTSNELVAGLTGNSATWAWFLRSRLRGVKLLVGWGGRVKGYAVYTRGAQEAWVQAARGECNRNDASETVLFAAPRPAMAVKLLLTSGVDPDAAYASLAEIELLPVEK